MVVLLRCSPPTPSCAFLLHLLFGFDLGSPSAGSLRWFLLTHDGNRDDSSGSQRHNLRRTQCHFRILKDKDFRIQMPEKATMVFRVWISINSRHTSRYCRRRDTRRNRRAPVLDSRPHYRVLTAEAKVALVHHPIPHAKYFGPLLTPLSPAQLLSWCEGVSFLYHGRTAAGYSHSQQIVFFFALKRGAGPM